MAEDLQAKEIDAAFCEMGVKAPITDQEARLILATESANRALGEQPNVFDEATYIRIRPCKLSEPPECLARIVNLSKQAKNAPRSRWNLLEADHKDAFTDFLAHHTSTPE